MKLSVLTENTASGYFTAEHGLSYFIEYENKNVLFDTGHSDVFLRNAKKLNVDVNTAETVVLSHGHWDHGNGLKYLRNKKLICHPNCFIKRYRKNDSSNIGLELSYAELNNRFDIITSRESYSLSENIIFLGEIPRANSFEAQSTTFVDESRNDDFIMDDSALVIIINDELVVVSGCAHSGICNIVEYAKKITGLKTVKAVIGGFHLMKNNDQTKKTIEYFKDQNISQIIVSVGAIEGLAASVLATIDPGDEVILPKPTYSTHITQVRLASGIPVLVPLNEENNFTMDIEAIKQSITPRTKAIMFCTPNNPTGTVFPESTLRELGKIALENNLTVITDEAYEYFTFDNNKHFSIASIPELSKNVISNYTFTKTYAMTGWRIGYIHADEEMISQIKKAHIPLAICAPVASQYAAIAALNGSQDCIEEFRQHYLKARNLMCERLDMLDSVFAYVKLEGSYLMFPKIIGDLGNGSISFSKNLLKEARVSTTPGIDFGPTGENHIRLSFCVPEEMINKAFDRMEKYFRKNR